MFLFSNRSQMMSKCGKNKKVAHGAIAKCVIDMLNRCMATWNLFVLDNKGTNYCTTEKAFYFKISLANTKRSHLS